VIPAAPDPRQNSLIRRDQSAAPSGAAASDQPPIWPRSGPDLASTPSGEDSLTSRDLPGKDDGTYFKIVILCKRLPQADVRPKHGLVNPTTPVDR